MTDERSNTEANTGKKKTNGKPFSKGDPRINRKGRPKSFDALRDLAQQIAHEVALRGNEEKGYVEILFRGHKVTIAELILRQWAQSGKPELQRGFIEVAFGKVPTQIEIRDWRQAATDAGLNPDEVLSEFVGIISARMGSSAGTDGSDRDGAAEADVKPDVEASLPNAAP